MSRLLLIVAFGFALLAGCGGGDDGGGSGGGNALSKDEFVTQANKICREGAAKINAKTKEAQQKLQDAGNSAEAQQNAIADVLESTAKEYDPYLAQLRELNPPSELSADWDKFLSGIGDAFNLIPDLADATRNGDENKLSDLTTKFSQIAGDTRPFAQKYRLDDCLPENSPSS
jgi:uncharacterized phage infection (PIP) family protein YhgE